jgi:hypothetical protein
VQTDALRVWGQTHEVWQRYEGDEVYRRGIPRSADRIDRLVAPHPKIVYEERAQRLRELRPEDWT